MRHIRGRGVRGMTQKPQLGRRWIFELLPVGRRQGAGQAGPGPGTGAAAAAAGHGRPAEGAGCLESVIENLPDALSIYDAAGRLIFCNQTARRVLGVMLCVVLV